MKQNNDQTAARQAADVVDNVADGMRSAAHAVGGSVRNTAHAVHEAASQAAGVVGDTLEEVGQHARDSYDQARTKARSWERSLENSVRANPKTSLLLAIALGSVIATLWRRK